MLLLSLRAVVVQCWSRCVRMSSLAVLVAVCGCVLLVLALAFALVGVVLWFPLRVGARGCCNRCRGCGCVLLVVVACRCWCCRSCSLLLFVFLKFVGDFIRWCCKMCCVVVWCNCYG